MVALKKLLPEVEMHAAMHAALSMTAHCGMESATVLSTARV